MILPAKIGCGLGRGEIMMYQGIVEGFCEKVTACGTGVILTGDVGAEGEKLSEAVARVRKARSVV